MVRHEMDETAHVRPATVAPSAGPASPVAVAEIEKCLRVTALSSRPPIASPARRVARWGMFVCAVAAVAAAVVVGMFPTAWFATDPNSKTPPKEATSMDQLDPEQIAGLLKRGRELIAAGDVALARLVLKRGAEAGNASAALQLGTTYDPFVIRELTVPTPLERDARLIGGAPRNDSDEAVSSRLWGSPGWLGFSGVAVSVSDMSVAPDIAMAVSWYEKAKDLGSAEAQGRLDGLAGRER
jgi:hypothetical protein